MLSALIFFVLIISSYQQANSDCNQEACNDCQGNSCVPKFTVTLGPYIDPQGWVRILVKEDQEISLDFQGRLTK